MNKTGLILDTAPLNDFLSLNGQGITGTESLTQVHTWTLISGSLVLHYDLVQTANQWPFSTCLSRFRHCPQVYSSVILHVMGMEKYSLIVQFSEASHV